MHSFIFALYKLLGLRHKAIQCHRPGVLESDPDVALDLPIIPPWSHTEPAAVQLRTTLTILSMAGDDYSNTIIWIGEDASGTKEDPESSLNRFLGVLASAPSAHDQPMIRIVIQPGIYAQTQAFVMVNRILGSIVRYPWHQIGIEFPGDFNLPCRDSLLLSVSGHAPIMISIPSLQHLDLKGHFGMSFPWYSLSDIPFQQLLSLKLSFPIALGDCTAILSQAPNLLDAEFHGVSMRESKLKQKQLPPSLPRLSLKRLSLASTVDVQPMFACLTFKRLTSIRLDLAPSATEDTKPIDLKLPWNTIEFIQLSAVMDPDVEDELRGMCRGMIATILNETLI